jgi:hypothetical protein
MQVRRWATAALAAAAVTLAGTAALASTGSGGTDSFVADVASHLGVQPSALVSAIQQADIDRVHQLQSSGKITADQAQRMISAIQSGQWHWLGGHAGPHGHRGGPEALGRGTIVTAASNYLGLPTSQVLAELRSGKSLAQIASGVPGKSADGLQQALLAAVRARLDQAVQSGKLTAEREQAILAKVQQDLPKLLQRTWGPHRPPAQSSGTSATGSA